MLITSTTVAASAIITAMLTVVFIINSSSRISTSTSEFLMSQFMVIISQQFLGVHNTADLRFHVFRIDLAVDS